MGLGTISCEKSSEVITFASNWSHTATLFKESHLRNQTLEVHSLTLSLGEVPRAGEVSRK